MSDFEFIKGSVYVAGHRGLVGSAIVRRLKRAGCLDPIFRTRADLDLTRQDAVDAFFRDQQPELVFLAAAKVGGILANDTRPAEFIAENLAIELNIIQSAWRHGTRKLVFLGSSCIYPRDAPQPMREEYLLTGPLESTNDAYAIAKIAGIKLCQAFRKQYDFDAISLMPTNLYGPGDSFDLASSHVLPALIRRFHEAKVRGDEAVTIWGTGTPLREFLHADDLADAAWFLAQHYSSPEIVNVGVGRDISIGELAQLIAKIVGFEGEIRHDTSKPDGTPRKLLDVSRLTALGWEASIGLREGIESTYAWFLANSDAA